MSKGPDPMTIQAENSILKWAENSTQAPVKIRPIATLNGLEMRAMSKSEH